MSENNQFSAAEKLAIIQEFEVGEDSRIGVAQKHGISVNTLVKWRHCYELYGYEGLEIRTQQKTYSVELKLQAGIKPSKPYNKNITSAFIYCAKSLKFHGRAIISG